MTARSSRSRINASIAFAILAALVMGCDAWVRLDGIVITEKGEGVGGAKIQVYQGKSRVDEVISERDGTFHVFGSIAPFFGGDLRIVVSKEGFREQEVELKQLKDGPNGQPPFRTVILRR